MSEMSEDEKIQARLERLERSVASLKEDIQQIRETLAMVVRTIGDNR